MARRASGKLAVVVDFMEESDSLGVGDGIARVRHALDLSVALASGTTDGTIDRLWSGSGTATSTPTDIDVSGALTSPLAAGAVVLTDLVFIVVQNTGSANLRLGGDANTVPFVSASDVQVIPPGGFTVLYGGPGGWPVTAGTGDILQLDSPTTTTYKLILGGRSA